MGHGGHTEALRLRGLPELVSDLGGCGWWAWAGGWGRRLGGSGGGPCGHGYQDGVSVGYAVHRHRYWCRANPQTQCIWAMISDSLWRLATRRTLHCMYMQWRWLPGEARCLGRGRSAGERLVRWYRLRPSADEVRPRLCGFGAAASQMCMTASTCARVLPEAALGVCPTVRVAPVEVPLGEDGTPGWALRAALPCLHRTLDGVWERALLEVLTAGHTRAWERGSAGGSSRDGVVSVGHGRRGCGSSGWRRCGAERAAGWGGARQAGEVAECGKGRRCAGRV